MKLISRLGTASNIDGEAAVASSGSKLRYRLQLQVQTSRGSNVFDWNVAIQRVLHNQALDEQIFSK